MSAMATLSVSTLGQPHGGFVPGTVTVRRTGAKPGAVTSRTYVPAVPPTRQIASQEMWVTAAPETWMLTPSTAGPEGVVTLMMSATGKAQGRARQSWPHD